MKRRRLHYSGSVAPHSLSYALLLIAVGIVCNGAAVCQEQIEPPAAESFDAVVDDVLAAPAAELGDASLDGRFDVYSDDGQLETYSACDEPWAPLGEDELALKWDGAVWRPFDRLRQLGFRHSSTHGRHVGRGLPLEHTSWLNRPYHVDWFLGPLLGDDLVSGRVGQSNVAFGGVRVGWDFDYYWGVQWRFGWADPTLDTNITTEELSGRYFVSDVDVLYFPWGDSKARPYLLWGLGLVEVGSVRDDGSGQEATLLGMPFGAGIQFAQTPWLAWRLEVLDNLAFGGDGISTMNNFSFTAGMEFRLGARPHSYWPWRSSRKVW